jgi:hypothetical protein
LSAQVVKERDGLQIRGDALFRLLSFGDVTRDFRRTDNLPSRVGDGRDRERDIQLLAVFAAADRFIMFD